MPAFSRLMPAMAAPEFSRHNDSRRILPPQQTDPIFGKLVTINREDETEFISRMGKVMQMNHANTARYHNYRELGRTNVHIDYYITSLRHAGGNLDQAIRQDNIIVPNEEFRYSHHSIRKALRDLLTALAYLHSVGIFHCDIKPENVVLNLLNGCWTIIDFENVAVSANVQSRNETTGFTPRYAAPELLEAIGDADKTISGKVDIWSLGCCAIKLCSGQDPKIFTSSGCFLELELTEMAAIIYGVVKLCAKPKVPALDRSCKMNELLLDFIAKCLCFCPGERPTATELLQHPYLNTAA